MSTLKPSIRQLALEASRRPSVEQQQKRQQLAALAGGKAKLHVQITLSKPSAAPAQTTQVVEFFRGSAPFSACSGFFLQSLTPRPLTTTAYSTQRSGQMAGVHESLDRGIK